MVLAISLLSSQTVLAQEESEPLTPPVTMDQRVLATEPALLDQLNTVTSPLDWQADDCGCVPTRLPFVTYGIFPSWEQQDQVPVKIDFSLLARIGYYGLSPDREGNINDSGHWQDPGFKETALRYESRVDLVVSNHAWQEQGLELENPCVYKNLTDDIVQLLQNTDGNGVTIDFSTIPGQMKSAYVLFITKLSEALTAGKANYNLNLVIPYFDKGEEYFSKSELEDLAASVDLFLVMHDQSESEEEGAKQQQLINLLSTYANANIRRKLVPVLDSGSEKFTDHYTFIVDNEFGGIGVWTIGQGQEKKLELNSLFKPEVEKMDYIKQLQYNYLPSLCKAVCPNRYLVKTGTNILFGGYCIFLLLCIFFWELDNILKKYLLVFLVFGFSILLLFQSLVLCVPQWSGNRTEMTIFLFLVVVGFFIKQHYDRKKENDYP